MKTFEGVILKMEAIDETNSFETAMDDLHIAFGIDANFALGMGVCMTSIILNNSDAKINFHVFTDQIRCDDLRKLRLLTKYNHVKIYIYYVDIKAFKNFSTTSDWTYATYFRFIMGEYLENVAKKVLYLDADVLCLQSLKELIASDMEDCIILGICDFMEIFSQRIQELSIKNGRYFNAGVMYIDINKWNQDDISNKAITLLTENPGKYKSLDQDVLNILLDGKTKFVHKKWDYIYNMGYMNHQLPEEVVLLHFAGDKPWQRWSEHHFMVKRYDEYLMKSPWADIPPSEPVHYKEKHRMSKSYQKRKDYILALVWYFKYLVARSKSRHS